MKRTILATATLLALSTAVLAAEENTVTAEVQVGAWAVAAHHGEVTGGFSHCSALTTYTPRTQSEKSQMRAKQMGMIVKLHANRMMSFGLLGDGWTLRAGKTYNIEFLFDNRVPFNIDATATNQEYLAADFDPSVNWYVAMIKAHKVMIKIEGQIIGTYNLNDSAKALSALIKCAGEESETAATFGDGRDQAQPASKEETF